MSTLISIADSEPGDDFGVMARHEGNPVPHEHEFYRTTLMGLFSIDLRMLGRFYHIDRTGYKHLDSIRKEIALQKKLQPYDNDRAFELSPDARKKRLTQLLQGLSQIAGGAKLALHYTDVSPRLLMLAVSKGGNHLFGTAVSANSKGLPKLNVAALKQIAEVYKDSLKSKFHVGMVEGYLDDQRAALIESIDQINGNKSNSLPHPVQAINQLLAELDQKADEWLA